MQANPVVIAFNDYLKAELTAGESSRGINLVIFTTSRSYGYFIKPNRPGNPSVSLKQVQADTVKQIRESLGELYSVTAKDAKILGHAVAMLYLMN